MKNIFEKTLKKISTGKKSRNVYIISVLAIASMMSCNKNEKVHEHDQYILKQLNHLSETNPSKLKKTIDSLWFDKMWQLLSIRNEDYQLNATVLETTFDKFESRKMIERPKESRIRLVISWIANMNDVLLTNDDMPNNRIEDKILYHNKEANPKVIEFVENKELYKNMAIILGSEYEGKQLTESFKKYGKWITKVNESQNISKYIYDWNNIYIIKNIEWIKEFDNNYDGKLWLIVLKWHHGMLEEFDAIKDKIQKKSTILLAWWCTSFGNTSDYLDAWALPITNKEVGKWSINDPLTFALIKWLPSEWYEETTKKYKKRYPKNTKDVFVFPDNELAQKVNGAM